MRKGLGGTRDYASRLGCPNPKETLAFDSAIRGFDICISRAKMQFWDAGRTNRIARVP